MSSNGSIIYMVTASHKLLVSKDHGGTWTDSISPEKHISNQSPTNRRRRRAQVGDLLDGGRFHLVNSIVSRDGQVIAILTSDGTHTAWMLVSQNAGGAWAIHKLGGKRGSQPRMLKFCGRNEKNIVLGAYNDDKRGLMVTKDYGASLTQIPKTQDNIWASAWCSADAATIVASVSGKYKGTQNPIVPTRDHYGFLWKGPKPSGS